MRSRADLGPRRERWRKPWALAIDSGETAGIGETVTATFGTII